MTSRPLHPRASARELFLRAVPALTGLCLLALALGVWSLSDGALAAATAWGSTALATSLLLGLASAVSPSERARFRLAALTLAAALGGGGLIVAAYAL